METWFFCTCALLTKALLQDIGYLEETLAAKRPEPVTGGELRHPHCEAPWHCILPKSVQYQCNGRQQLLESRANAPPSDLRETMTQVTTAARMSDISSANLKS